MCGDLTQIGENQIIETEPRKLFRPESVASQKFWGTHSIFYSRNYLDEILRIMVLS